MTTRYWRSGGLVPNEHWHWPNFSPREMTCRGSGELRICEEFMDRLQKIRTWMGRPLVVSSGYRSPAYNNRVSKTGFDGPHTTGRAVDILIYGDEFLRLLVAARDFGMTGFGVAQTGPWASRFLHLDDLPDASGQPRPWAWGY